MALVAGTKLGPYEIESPLGAGGMGEVYRAKDTRLDRTVAIKILPTQVSEDSEAKQRFDREARVISSLSHPNICQLYDVGSQDGISYIVMECLQGETLADRLEKGPLSLEQMLRYGIEICEGLGTAHRNGVIHRDLKPGNIMLTKTGVKLMDFGLAKPVSITSSPSGLTATSAPPGKSHPLTVQGTIVGTLQYMSPEQIEGKEADTRSDIFSLGCVLYEMATGKRPFEGKSTASIMAAVLEREPIAISTVTPALPVTLDRVVKACLAKDPDERLQTVQDVKLQLQWLGEEGQASGSQARPEASGSGRLQRRERVVWLVTMLCALLVVAFAVYHLVGQRLEPVVQTSVGAANKLRFNFAGDAAGPPAISPDGAHIVFSAKNEGKDQLYVRTLSDLSIRPLPGTDNGRFPFWSPDSRSVAFFAEGKLKRLDISGGMPVAICDANNPRGGSWGSTGMIVFAPSYNSSLLQVAAAGGTPAQVLQLDSPKYSTYRWPWFLPDGKHFLYFAANHLTPNNPSTGGVFFASLDGKENRLLFTSASNAIYASGYLLYLSGNALQARPFDPASGQVKGDSTVLAGDAQNDRDVWRGIVTASENGLLLYQPAMTTTGLKLAWFDRSGKQLEQIGEEDEDYQVRLSPDEKKLALAIGQPNHTIWIYDLAREAKSRFTFDDKCHSSPVWSPDGSRLAYSVAEGALQEAAVFSKASNGAGEPKQILGSVAGDKTGQSPSDWSPDGRWIIYTRGTLGAGSQGTDLWAFPADGSGQPFPYVTGPGDQQEAQFSPDGHFVAYESNEAGNPEIYVAAFPRTGAKWQVSNNGGAGPRWSQDGQELFFLSGDQIMSVRVDKVGPGLEMSQPHLLFRLNLVGENSSRYSVTRDGKRFVAIVSGQDSSPPLVLVQNWTMKLKQ
ncbi:MAG: protein kinase [Candidatus Korobacteraceae bacterium]